MSQYPMMHENRIPLAPLILIFLILLPILWVLISFWRSAPQSEPPVPKSESVKQIESTLPPLAIPVDGDQVEIFTPEESRGYGDLTAYEVYDESQLIDLMETSGDPLAATALVERLEEQGDLTKIAYLTYLFQLVGSTAAINTTLAWYEFEWEELTDSLHLTIYAHLLGDDTHQLVTEGLTEEQIDRACNGAYAEFNSNNLERISLGWTEFPPAKPVGICSEQQQ